MQREISLKKGCEYDYRLIKNVWGGGVHHLIWKILLQLDFLNLSVNLLRS